MNKKEKKLIDKKCYFCGNEEYHQLDVHRIVPGSEGGKYKRSNCVTVCANCHRKIHAGAIRIAGRHYTSAGHHILHYFENEQEFWR